MTIPGASALLLSAVSTTVSALDMAGVDMRGQAEASWEYAPARGNTVFNPGGMIVNNPEQTGILGLRLSPHYNSGPFTLRGDFWGQGILADSGGHGNFYTQSAALDFNLTDNLVLSGGVDLFKWGPGYIWNPSNPFQDRELNFTDRVFSYKRDGDVYASLDWTGGDGIGATAYFVDDKSREKFYGPNVPYSRSFALKLRKQFNSSDLAFTYALVGDMNFMGSSYSAAIGDKLELHGEISVRDRRRAALPFVVADPAGGGYFTLRQDGQVQWRPQLLVGGQYTTEGLTNYILEYYYNGEAYSSHEFGQLQTAGILSTLQLQGPTAGQSASFLGSANGLLGSMERHYLFARVASEHWIGDLDARIYFRYGIQDSGTLLGGLLRYPLPRSAAILLGGQYYGNAAHSETASIPYEFVLYSGITLVF
jgi:hypothetical protein